MDGTLVDTEPAAAAAVNRCFQTWGIQTDPDDAAFVTGRTWQSAFNYLFRKYPPPIPAHEAARAMLEEYRRSLESNLWAPVPGGPEAVRSLVGTFRLGLVSGSGRRDIVLALEELKIRECFDVIYGAEDYAQSKPSPDGYSRALETLATRPENALVFEDSEAGIASALNAGTWVVAITGTNHFSQDTSGAHLAIRDLTPVNPKWISQLRLTRRE